MIFQSNGRLKMDLDSAWIFVRVVQTGSFSAAARSLQMPVSTVSAKVSQLEERLSTSLMVRTTRKLQLTESGTNYFKHAVAACREIEAAEAAIAAEKDEIEGVVRLTAPVEMGSTSLTDVVSDFLKAHPKVRVELILTDRVVDLVAEGVDFAIRVGELPDSSLICRKIGTTELHIYASPSYLKKFGEPKSPNDLEHHHCLNFQDSVSGTWDLHVKTKGNVSVVTKGTVATNNLISLQRFVVHGRGLALLPRFLCIEDEQAGRLKHVLKSCTAESLPIHLVYPQQKFVQRRVQMCMEFVTDNLHELF